jgi:DNA polymerase-3 subunit gamma/tau
MTETSDASGDALPMPPAAGDGMFGAPPAPAPAAAPYRVLARKYRPATFDDLIGQDAMVRVLRRAFAVGRVAHAFMLTGVRGVGKTTTARIIARALACVGPDGKGGPTADPCGVCPNCTGILADRHPDVLEMDAASRTGVDDVREIIDATRFRPMQARAKVFIIDEVHMLSRNAFNALLKTLEEPPPHVTFIFATTELRKVPVTVLSRCQRFDLKRVAQSALVEHFRRVAAAEGYTVAEAALELIARAADGSVRDGLSLLDQAIAHVAIEGGERGTIEAATVSDMLGLADRGLVFDLLEAVMAGRPAAALRLSEQSYASGADPGQVLGDLLDLLHVLTRIKSIPELAAGGELPELERTRGAALAEQLSVASLSRAWQMLLKGMGELEAAPDRQAAAEMALIRLCYVSDAPTPGDLVRRLSAAPPPAPSPGGGGGMARGGGGTAVALASEPVPAAAEMRAQPTSWREVVALVGASGREPILHGHLRHAVHPVRVAPGIVEIRQQTGTPRDLAGRLAAVLRAETGTRWTVALSTQGGEPTLDEQSEAVRQTALQDAEQHPLIREIMRVFPGARIGGVVDDRLDAYGLPAEMATVLGGGEFAPLDAEFASDIVPADPEDGLFDEREF